MDELQKELNLKQYMASNLSNALEINLEAAQKVKREVEKKEYYCKVLWEFEKTNPKIIINCKQMGLTHQGILLINNMLKFIKAQVKKL